MVNTKEYHASVKTALEYIEREFYQNYCKKQEISSRAKSGDLVFNMQPFNVLADVEKEDKFYTQEAPSYGFAVDTAQVGNSVIVQEKHLGNKFYAIDFDENYEIVRTF